MNSAAALELPPQQLLALRILDRDYALEPDRHYLIGAHPECDIRIEGAGVLPIHAHLRMRGHVPLLEPLAGAEVVVNGFPAEPTQLRVGDTLQIAGTEPNQGLRIVRDSGLAEILPDPLLRAAHKAPIKVGPKIPLSQEHAEQRFQDMLAQELRRTPWLGLSLLAHALLILLLLWLMPASTVGSGTVAVHGFLGQTEGLELDGGLPDQPPVIVEPSELEQPELHTIEEPPLDTEILEPTTEPEPPTDLDGFFQANSNPLQKIFRSKTRLGDQLLDTQSGAKAQEFRTVVKDLRTTGLEIVFVFDSTGSMDSSIAAAKANIDEMLQTLRALVPSARFGLVTYRDKGRREEYLVRQIALTHDFFAAANFMQGIGADGGGDNPEAVLAGLDSAFNQPFQKGSRRVVVLVGDAPPHSEEMPELLSAVRRFTRKGMASVHTLVTDKRLGPDPKAAAMFEQIAKRGKGVSSHAKDPDQILQRVLTAAFGKQFGGNLASIRDQLRSQRQSPPTWALDAARRGGRLLALKLRQQPVSDEVVNALLRRLSHGVALELIDLLAQKDLSSNSRNAIAYVLQQQMELARSPVDPANPQAISRKTARRLRAMAKEVLPD